MNLASIIALASFLCAGGLAFAVLWSRDRSLAHWSFAGGMAVLAIESLFAALSADSVLSVDMVYWQNLCLLAMSFLPGVWLLFSLTYARGNYREFLIRWRYSLALAFLGPVGLALALILAGHLITAVVQVSATGHMLFPLELSGLFLQLLVLITFVLILMNLERTFRASVGTMRWRIKFMIIGLGVLFIARAYTGSQVLLFRRVDLYQQAVNSGALLVACLLIFRALLRAGHFEVNLYPSHSFLQNSLTISLAGLYLLIVGVFAKVVTFLGGDAAFPFKAFIVLAALVLLTLLLLSDQVRLHTKRFVSRHLQRPLHDYRTVWKNFTEGTASHVESAELCRAVAKFVTDLFQVLSVTIWLVDDKQEALTPAASTSLSSARGDDLTPKGAEAAQLLQAMRAHPDPLDFDVSTEPWTAVLRRCHPGEFQKGGHRVCVPLLARGELLGFMTLGDRVGGIPFSIQDFDLLKCVADQAAANLLNLHLSQRLLQARELEAFQTMSAFFVHDLKNTASTLSLMLKNLPVHFDNPAFREDALRAVGKTVTHINDLIGRLSLLRQNLAINPVETDLNDLVRAALKPLEATATLPLEKDFQPVPKVPLDPEQMQKVVTNLVLNAQEALGPGGKVHIATSRQDSWAVFSVSDNGCGMSPDFVARSLFRPFQTTKKQGIGIGMFQCKMIVEAHHGKIEVETEPNHGTIFRVKLPLQSKP